MSLYERNIEYFKTVKFNATSIGHILENLTEGPYELADGEIVNSDTKVPVYPENPLSYTQKQFKAWSENPLTNNTHISNNPYDMFMEYQAENAIVDIYEDMHKSKSSLDEYIPCFFLFGRGSGHILDVIVDSLDVGRLFIVDPDLQMLKETLHVFDYVKLAKKCEDKGTLLVHIFNSKPENIVLIISDIMRRIGQHNIANSFNYKHIDSPMLDQTFEYFIKNKYAIMSSDGFIGDERLGLAHTVHNIEHDVKILRFKKNNLNVPALIVGNGPSLNNDIEFIKKNRNKMFVVSCGSTLYTLYKHGITPHLHVEMERSADTTPLIRDNLPRKYLKSIRFIGLNTTHPGVFNLFKGAYMAAKDNDISEPLLRDVYDRQINVVRHMNPVVANCAYSIITECRFKEIYLVGVDTGTIDTDKHHASGSQYDEDADNRLHSIEDMNKEVPGNFQDTAYTSTGLNRSILSFINRSNELDYDRKQYNMSDGARIHYFEPTHSSDVKLTNKVLSKDKLDKFFKKNFMKPVCTYKLRTAIRNKLAKARDVLVTYRYPTEIPRNHKQLLKFLDYQLSQLHQLDFTNYRLVGGSIQNSNNKLATLSCCALDDEDRYKKVVKTFNNFYKASAELCDRYLFELDFDKVQDSYVGWNDEKGR